jgi:hypothetical protein
MRAVPDSGGATPTEILAMESGAGGLGFSLENTSKPGGPVVYLSTDAAVGRLELKIRNDSTASVSLTPDSGVTLAMAGVLTAEQAKALRLEGKDWAIAGVDGTSLTLSPNALTHLEAGSSTAVVLQQVLASGRPRTHAVQIGYAKVDGATDASRSLMLFVHHPPEFNTELPLRAEFDQREGYGGGGDSGKVVYTTPADSPDVKNILKFALSNKNPQQPIPLAPDSTPRLIVSFITGNGRDALCTDDQLTHVNCNPDQGDPHAPWTVEPQTENGVRTWILTPAAQSDELFPASARIVSFVSDSLVTTAEAGDTLMYIQHTGVPNFDDGYVALPIQKMRSLKLTANGVEVVGASSTLDWAPTVQIAWESDAAPRTCSLKINGVAIDLTGKNPSGDTITYTPPDQWDRPFRCEFLLQGGLRIERKVDLACRMENELSVQITADRKLRVYVAQVSWRAHGTVSRTLVWHSNTAGLSDGIDKSMDVDRSGSASEDLGSGIHVGPDAFPSYTGCTLTVTPPNGSAPISKSLVFDTRRCVDLAPEGPTRIWPHS